MNREDFDRISEDAKRKIQAARYRVASAAKKSIEWATENPELAISIITATTFFANKAWKISRDVVETHHQNSKIYDHSLGMYWELRHPLTTNERIIIERRRKNGEPYGEILRDMRLLKH